MTDFLVANQSTMGERLMRAFDIKSDLPDHMDAQFGLSVTVEDLTAPEYLFLRRESRWIGAARQAAVAGQFSFCALGFAATAGQRGMINVDQIVISNENVAVMSVFVGVVALGLPLNVPPTGPLDDRQWVGATQAGLGALGNQAAVGLVLADPNYKILLPASSSVTIQLPATLTNLDPGGGSKLALMFQTAAVNQTLCVAATWRERALLTSEAK